MWEGRPCKWNTKKVLLPYKVYTKFTFLVSELGSNMEKFFSFCPMLLFFISEVLYVVGKKIVLYPEKPVLWGYQCFKIYSGSRVELDFTNALIQEIAKSRARWKSFLQKVPRLSWRAPWFRSNTMLQQLLISCPTSGIGNCVGYDLSDHSGCSFAVAKQSEKWSDMDSILFRRTHHTAPQVATAGITCESSFTIYLLDGRTFVLLLPTSWQRLVIVLTEKF